MPGPRSPERLRFSPRSAFLAIGMLGLALTAIRLTLASQRVIGWILAAVAIACLLYPFVAALSRRMPRGAAVVIVVVLTLSSLGFVGYNVAKGVARQTAALKRAAPHRAAQLERSKRFGAAARDFKLKDRVTRFVDEVPQRLQGGKPAAALRSAADRGIAFLATGILAIFFLLEGPTMAANALKRVSDDERRLRVGRMANAAYHRGFGYARGTIGMSLTAGLFAYLMARTAGVPGAAPLGFWVALWDIVPLIGSVIGALPIVTLAAADSTRKAIFLTAAFLAYQLFESVATQRPLNKRTVTVGPFLTVVGGFAGLELYGLGGALLVLLLLSCGVAALDELANVLADTEVHNAAPSASPAGADGLEIGAVGVIKVGGRRPAEDLGDEV